MQCRRSRCRPGSRKYNRLLKQEKTIRRRAVWAPEDAITFTPPLSDVVYGDGGGLFASTTMNDRPAFWAVRGDSSWRTWLKDNGTDIVDFVEVIEDASQPRRHVLATVNPEPRE